MLVCLLFSGCAVALFAVPEAFTSELQSDLYDCQISLTAGARMPDTAQLRLALETGDEDGALLLTITPRAVYLASQFGEVKTMHGQRTIKFPSTLTSITVHRRGGQMSVRLGDLLLFSASVPRGAGGVGQVVENNGWTIDEVEISRLEAVIFADDFMRTSEDAGAWTVHSGQWGLQSAWDHDPHGNSERFNHALYAQNPFAWRGTATGDTAAICLTGEENWEDYACSASVRPQRGAFGILVNVTDGQQGLLARWSAANDRTTRGDRLTLERWVNGKTTVLATARGGYIPGQWYRVSVVSSLAGVAVLIDGEERVRVNAVTPWRGSVGLYTEGAVATVFDDVTVYGRTLDLSLLAENAQERIQNRFLRDQQGMREWASPEEWATRADGSQVQRQNYYGNQWLVISMISRTTPGTLEMTLQGDGTGISKGARAQVTADMAERQWRYRLLVNDTLLAEANTAMPDNGEEVEIRFYRRGDMLSLVVDDTPVVTAHYAQQLPGVRPAYRLQGNMGRLRNVLMMSDQYRDYTFTEAPVDWIGEGTWLPTVRWACEPQWSFYSGWSRGDAVLWHKQRFSGDHALQVYMGFKMEYPREREIYEETRHYHDANIAICTDGRDPRSGYALVSGQADAFGRPSMETVLLRNGVPVRRVNASVYGWGMAHRAWFDLELRKRGDVVECWIDGALVMSYRDPQPLEGGVPAIWTHDMGISVARARLRFAQLPEVRHDPQVVLDEPGQPEWLNIGQPFTLDFPNAMATSGKAVSLNVRERLAPSGAALPTVKGKRLTVTPNQIGEYWYQVHAGDGKTSSPAFHLFGQAFDPARGRDDSRALVLYYFTEGQGDIVKDHSAIAPPANLRVPAFPNTRWLPEQGLSFSGPEPLKSEAAVEKLMAIARNKACTVEFWVSNDTAYFPVNWLGCLLSWEKDVAQRNLLIGGHKATFVAAPFGANFDPTNNDNSPNLRGAYTPYLAFRTNLHHMVVRWDGTSTQAFVDGKSFDAAEINWNIEQWVNDASLLLGNRSDGKRPYLGSYYLLAIHDQALSDAQILRHYQAGPSARWLP